MEILSAIAVIIAIGVFVWGFLKWWARKNRGGKVADTITNTAEDTSDWPIVEVKRANDWPNKAQETGELERGNYSWANDNKLGVDGREVVEIVDHKQRTRQIFKSGTNTLIRKR